MVLLLAYPTRRVVRPRYRNTARAGVKFASHVAALSIFIALCALVGPVAADDARLRAHVSSLPLAFEPNVGQAPGDVRYVSRGPRMRLELTPDDARPTPTTGAPQSRTIRLRIARPTQPPPLTAPCRSP